MTAGGPGGGPFDTDGGWASGPGGKGREATGTDGPLWDLYTDELIERALREDLGPDGVDITSAWTVPPDRKSRAVIVAKTPTVLSGLDCVRTVFERVGGTALSLHASDGDAVDADTVLCSIEGRTRSILTAERVALNFLGRLSGIATLTRRFVAAVEGTRARVIDTRKTTPGWRMLEKQAVRHGGGTNHRMGLYDMALVKDNHADAAGGVAEAASAAVRRARERSAASGEPRIQVEVEVRDLQEFEAVLTLGVDRILLDNMPPEAMARAVERAAALGSGRPLLEASGNVTLETVATIARSGVDLISVGALTHSAPSADVSLRTVPDGP